LTKERAWCIIDSSSEGKHYKPERITTMYEILNRTCEGCETLDTADTLEKAIEIADKWYIDLGGDLATSEESVEVWKGRDFMYMAG
jgi:hypothetical protein